MRSLALVVLLAQRSRVVATWLIFNLRENVFAQMLEVLVVLWVCEVSRAFILSGKACFIFKEAMFFGGEHD